MSQESSSSNLTKFAESSLSILEKMTQFKAAILLLSFVLAVDLGLSRNGQGGILNLNVAMMKEGLSIGHILVFIATYSFYMSAGAAIVKFLVEQVLCVTVFNAGYKFLHRYEYKPDKNEYVLARDLRNYAIRENNQMAMKIYEEEILAHNKGQDERHQISHLSFACALLIVVGLTFPGNKGALSLVHAIAIDGAGTSGGAGAAIFCAALWLFSLAPWLFRFFSTSHSPVWIEHRLAAQGLPKDRER